MVQFKGSGIGNFRNFNLKLFYNLLFSGHFKTCIDSSLNKMSKLAPTAMEVTGCIKKNAPLYFLYISAPIKAKEIVLQFTVFWPV